jgi:hypothetical protein
MSGKSVRVLPPQSFKPCRIARGISYRVLNVTVFEIVLNEPRIRALIGEGVTVDWHFTTADARIKLKRLGPVSHE